MADAEVKLAFTADTSSAAAAQNDIRASFNELNNTISTSNDKLAAMDGAVHECAYTIGIAAEKAKQLGDPSLVQKLNDALLDGTERAAAMGDSYDKACDAFTKLAERATALGEAFAKNEISREQLMNGMQELTTAAQEQADAVERLAERLDAARLAERQEELRPAFESAAQAINQETTAEKNAGPAMQYASMTRRELLKTITELTAARKAAAKANDAQQYVALSGSIKEARGALRTMKQEMAVARMQTIMQAQAGMNLANSINNISENALSSSPNIAAMANSVIALGMAIKAGMGPIGWIMMALQALQIIIDKVRSSRAREEEEAAAAAKRLAEERKKQAELEKKISEENIENIRNEIDAEQELLQAKIEANRRYDEIEEGIRKAGREADQKRADSQLALEKNRLDMELLRGNITQENYDKELAAANRLHDNRIKKLDEEAIKADVDSKERAWKRAREEESALEDQLRKYKQENEAFFQVKLPPPQEIEALGRELEDRTKNTEREKAFQDQTRESWEKLRDAMTKIGINIWHGGIEADQALFREIVARQDIAKQLEKQLEELKQSHELTWKEYKAAEREAGMREDQLKLDEQVRKSTAELAAARAEEARNQAAERERQAKAQAAERERQEKERAAAKEADKLNKQITEELKRINEAHKTSRQYQEQDRRTEAQKIIQDRHILQSRVDQLQALQAQAVSQNASEKTQRDIEKSLETARSELRGYQQAIRDGRLAALNSLQQWKQQGANASNKTMQGNVRALQRSMEKMARQYGRAAEKGDSAAMAKIQGHAAHVAQNLERLTGNTGKYADDFQAMVTAGTRAREAANGLSAAEQRELDTLQKTNVNTARRKTLEDKIAKFKQQHADAEQKAAQNAASGTRQGATNPVAGTLQQSAASMQQAAASLQQAQTVFSSLNSTFSAFGANIQTLISTAQQIVGITNQVASASASGQAALSNSIKNLQNQVNRLSALR